jgi:hypothetical protein
MDPNLSILLAEGHWRLANEKTRLLLGSHESWQGDTIKKIDSLWLASSENQFGFSVQWKLYKKLGGSKHPGDAKIPSLFESLGDTIGWRRDGYWACWADVDYWPQIPLVPLIPVELDPNDAPEGLLPLHDVVTSGDWKHEFSPRDCWGEAAWRRWAQLFRTLDND